MSPAIPVGLATDREIYVNIWSIESGYPICQEPNLNKWLVFESSFHCYDLCLARRFQSGFCQKTRDHGADSVAVVFSGASKDSFRIGECAIHFNPKMSPTS